MIYATLESHELQVGKGGWDEVMLIFYGENSGLKDLPFPMIEENGENSYYTEMDRSAAYGLLAKNGFTPLNKDFFFKP